MGSAFYLKKIFILFVVLIILLVLSAGIFLVLNIRAQGLLKEAVALQQRTLEMTERRFTRIEEDLAALKLKIRKSTLEALSAIETLNTQNKSIGNNLARLNAYMARSPREELAALEVLNSRSRDGIEASSMMGMIAEKIVYDYTQKALYYFEAEDYIAAYDMFTRALKYQRGNSTLLFFQIYSLYLANIDRKLTDGEFSVIESGLSELYDRGYSGRDQLVFTVEEMKQKTAEMGYNVAEIQKHDNRSEW